MVNVSCSAALVLGFSEVLPRGHIEVSRTIISGFLYSISFFPHKLVTQPASLLQEILVNFKLHLELLMVTGL